MSDQPDVATVIAQLEAERAELDVTIAHLRRRLGMPASADVSASPPATGSRDAIVAGRIRIDEFFRLSIPDAITKYLAIMKQPQNPAAIVAGLRSGGVLTTAKNFSANVNTELKRMRDRGLVVNTGTGSGWGLSDWYPARSKQNDAPKKKAAKKKRVKKERESTKKAARLNKEVAEPASDKPTAWPAYLGERLKAGKTMKEAAAEWKERKGKE